MHSRIIQISSKPIAKEDYITEDNISECDFNYYGMDYVCSTDDDAVERLSQCGLPKGFTLDKKERSLSYDGSLECIKDFKNKVKEAVDKFLEGDLVDGYNVWLVKNLLNEGFGPSFLYHWEDYIGGIAQSSRFFLDMINDGPKKVYIGGCLDYHF